MSGKLKPEHHEALEALVRFCDRGYAPTFRELCEELKLSSVSVLHRRMMELQKAGLVSWEPGKSRTFKVLGGKGGA